MRLLFTQSHFCTPGNIVTVQRDGETVCEVVVDKPAVYVAAEANEDDTWRLLSESDLRREWAADAATLLESKNATAKVTSNVSQTAATAVREVENALQRLGYAANSHGSDVNVYDCKEAIDRIGEAVMTLAAIIRDNLGDKPQC